MGLSSVMYIILNINEQCARFPNVSSLSIGLINGLYDASGNEQNFYYILIYTNQADQMT